MKAKERLKGGIIGAAIAALILTATPLVARVISNDVTIYFNNISVAINGNQAQLENEPFVLNGRTYLPVRDIANLFGYNATWESETNTVHLTERIPAGAVPNYPAHLPQPEAPPATTTGTAYTSRNNRPASPTITPARAIELAYEELSRLGIEASHRASSGLDFEQGRWVWELEFRAAQRYRGHHIIEFYICAGTGEVVKMEWDD
ncbi:MAG: stalk domain-containing protein [Defluviitaleaceae bacterium]|nr:stalk domain-containing protein [Defluviitaleaceae bacterium]